MKFYCVFVTESIVSHYVCSHMKKMDPLAAIGASGVMDMKKLADWFYNSRLDPNDPSNADIVYILRVGTCLLVSLYNCIYIYIC